MSVDQRQVIDLDLGGMTCASCAARIEKKLNKVDGVSAEVNYATESARVTAPVAVSTDDLIAVVEKAGYTASPAQPDEMGHPDHAQELRRRLIVSSILGIPVILVSMIPAWQFPGWQWIALILSTPVVLWGGYPFHRAAFINARHGATTMDTLISMGTLASYLWSVVALVFGSAGRIGLSHEFTFAPMRTDPLSNIYLETSVAITIFLLLGRYLEANARRGVGSALHELSRLGAKTVTVVTAEGSRDIAIAELNVGDTFIVQPGAKVATDGIVEQGASAIDAALVTGESRPIEVEPGDRVVGATMNTTGRLVVRATAVGEDTELATIARLVAQAQTGKSEAQRIADRISSFFVPMVLGLAALTLIGWLIAGGGVGYALSTAIAVLIIACPCALGLAIPTALLAGTSRGARWGIIITGPQALEGAGRVNRILFDKTGTITTGRMSVAEIAPYGDLSRADLLSIAEAVERGSDHPIAQAIQRTAYELDAPRLSASEHIMHPGEGMSAVVDGSMVMVGSRTLIQRSAVIPDDTDQQARSAPVASIMYLARGEQYLGMIFVEDQVRAEAPIVIQGLFEMKINPSLVTGDNSTTAHRVAGEIGLTQVDAPASSAASEASESRSTTESDGTRSVYASMTPTGKFELVSSLQSQGSVVAMVGDGVNDSAALAQADLGIAMGAGADAAIASGDIIILRDDLGLVLSAVKLARATLRTIRLNLFWAFAYNVAAIPLAMAGLLHPMLAGGAMALSSVLVLGNSLLLSRYTPRGHTPH